MTTKTTRAAKPVYDFDAWDESAEDAAIEALVEAERTRYIIVERDFIGRFSDGDIVRVPLLITMDVVDEITKLESKSPNEQLHDLLVAIGDEDAAKTVTSKTTAAINSFAEAYFRVFQRVNQASVGE